MSRGGTAYNKPISCRQNWAAGAMMEGRRRQTGGRDGGREASIARIRQAVSHLLPQGVAGVSVRVVWGIL